MPKEVICDVCGGDLSRGGSGHKILCPIRVSDVYCAPIVASQRAEMLLFLSFAVPYLIGLCGLAMGWWKL